MKIFFWVFLSIFLSGCGQRGSLYLPTEKNQPASDSSKKNHSEPL